jgi:Endonuclease NucS
MANIRHRKRKSPLQQIIEESKYASRKLIFNGQEVRFESEQDLESYLEDNFEEIFPSLNLLARQYTSSNQRCDLICSKKANKQLVVIELKNQVDRYIIAQLVRYRKALLVEQPFSDLVDYSLPIDLIAIAPIFHEDNHTDKESCKFEKNILFLTFTLSHEDRVGKFNLLERTYDINFPIAGLSEVITDSQNQHYYLLPEIGLFTNKLARLSLSSKSSHQDTFDYNQDFLNIHALFVRQPMIKHWVISSGRILYSTGKGANSKKLAEITNTDRGLYLYLWLPSHVKTNVKLPLARFGLACEENCSPLSLTSKVKWVVCTQDTVNLKEEPNRAVNSGLCSITRQGMPKWCNANSYLRYSAGFVVGGNTYQLLKKLLKELKKPLDIEDSARWEKLKDNTPTNLGWFVDLAIKTWNYRLR